MGENNEIAFNQFIDFIKPLGKYDENKLKQAWDKSWDKMNEQNTEELLSKITEVVENKIKSSEIKNKEDFKQTMDELMKSSIEKMMQGNLKKVMVEAFQEVMEENSINEYQPPDSYEDVQENTEATSIHKSSVQQRIFDINNFEDINNYNNYEVNL
ncbi:MAG: hypothetical protein KTV77_01995 [Wolbachia endosymbiont of Fragariocoptes setiger]|nr:hypothetical protein [Wolbachia endosymbiont of Fragariocoptes setiger]